MSTCFTIIEGLYRAIYIKFLSNRRMFKIRDSYNITSNLADENHVVKLEKIVVDLFQN